MSKQTVVVFSGAGLSAESGIPTFRDSNGLWENHEVEDVASPLGWVRDKELVLRFYRQRLEAAQKAQPNEAHKSIARLQDRFNVVNITQNVDDLLERAGCRNVVHLHGCLNRQKCEWHKDTITGPAAAFYECDYKVGHEHGVALGDVCPKCGGQLRPDVVWFDEAVDFPYEYCGDLLKEMKINRGVFICIGTSAQVYPAAYLLTLFAEVERKYIVDKKPLPIENYVLMQGNASEQMKSLADTLMDEVDVMPTHK